MLEKDIENLIAQYPNDFFPNAGFALRGQQVRLGRCYADIIFADKYERTIIIEVKRGILSRDAAGQIMEYYGLFKKEHADAVVELIVCANTIPHERKLFLENAGIECKELGLSLIQQVASRYNYKFLDELNRDSYQMPNVSSPTSNAIDFHDNDPAGNVWIFQANPTRYDILNALTDSGVNQYTWQINQHANDIKKGDIALIWMSGKDAGIYAVAEITSSPAIMRDFPEEEKYWTSSGDIGKLLLRAGLTITKVLVNSPIYRYELKAIRELEKLRILKMPQGTNFPVSTPEWDIIKALLENKLRSST